MLWKYLVNRLEAFGIGAVIGLMAFLVINVAVGRDIVPRAERTFEPIEGPAPLEMDPQRLYMTNCAACHQATGEGMPGQFPPLTGSQWVTEDPETPVRIVLLGLQGEITVQGQTYNGVMPAQSHLTDEQIAAVVTYVRTNFGNEASEIDPALVSTLRAELSGRGPWQGGAELAAARGE